MKNGPTLVMLAAAVMGTSGCVSWRPQTVPVAEVVSDPKVEVVRVTRRDSSTILVHQPRIENDTLSGLPTAMGIQRVNIPLADITEVATRYKHIGKTLLAAIAIGGGVLIYTLLQSLNQGF